MNATNTSQTNYRDMKVAVVGSRSFHNQGLVNQALDLIQQQILITLIVSGGAQGVDTLAEEYAKLRNIPTQIIRPDYASYGRSAPIVRNGAIVDKADFVIAFWNGQSPGTKNSIERATKAGKPLHVVHI